MAARLVIDANRYVLLLHEQGHWREIAVLHGGAGALLSPTRPVDEGRLEAAIEKAEDWLMPHAARLRGQVLDVVDATGRLASGLDALLPVATRDWTVDDVETFFLRLTDAATGRRPSPELDGRQLFIADVLLLRELAHHGRVQLIHMA